MAVKAVKAGRKGKIPATKYKALGNSFWTTVDLSLPIHNFEKMSLQKRSASFRYAINGLTNMFQTEPNARIHAIAATMAVLAGFFFQISRMEWIAVVLCIALVLSLEALNTAIEHLTDLVSPEVNPLAGKAKDVAAAAVLLGAIGSILVGALIFLPKIMAYFNF